MIEDIKILRKLAYDYFIIAESDKNRENIKRHTAVNDLKQIRPSKPNPSAVAVPRLDKENLRKEIGTILNACRKNNCNCDIVLKDISTCCKRPENIFEWEQLVMDMVKYSIYRLNSS